MGVVGVAVAVEVGVGVSVDVAVAVAVAVGVAVKVKVGVNVCVKVGVNVGTGVADGNPCRMICGFSQIALSFFCPPFALTTRMSLTVSPASALKSWSTG